MKMDRFLVDPSKLHEDEAYQNPPFAIMLTFRDHLDSKSGQIMFLDEDWEVINEI